MENAVDGFVQRLDATEGRISEPEHVLSVTSMLLELPRSAVEVSHHLLSGGRHLLLYGLLLRPVLGSSRAEALCCSVGGHRRGPGLPQPCICKAGELLLISFHKKVSSIKISES